MNKLIKKNVSAFMNPLFRFFLFLSLGGIILPGCGSSAVMSDSFSTSSIWIEIAWNGQSVSSEFAESNKTLGQLLGVDSTAFTPEKLLGGPGIHTILEYDPAGTLVAVHTTCDTNKQWVTDELNVSDAYFFVHPRTCALPFASPQTTGIDGVYEITDNITGLWRYGSIHIDVASSMTGLRFDQASQGSLNLNVTFTVGEDIPSYFLFGFSGVNTGETLTYRFSIPVAYQLVSAPAAEGFKPTSVIVSPAGTLPSDIGIQGGSLARELEVMGRLHVQE